MKFKSLLLACLLWPCIASAGQTSTYPVAHTRYRDANMVMVVTNSNFFAQNRATQERWYTALQVCIRNVKLAGDAVLVANVSGRFMFYGPKHLNGMLQSLDMNWVKARINKQVTCNY